MNIMVAVLRFLLALVCGALIGLEREARDKEAGLRTHILVALGACLFGMLGLLISAETGEADPLRVAQGILIGIGFLGAGVIMREGASIKGLTTAAGIWVMGGIGLACGTGYYVLAIAGTVFSFLTIVLFTRIEGKIKGDKGK